MNEIKIENIRHLYEPIFKAFVNNYGIKKGIFEFEKSGIGSADPSKSVTNRDGFNSKKIKRLCQDRRNNE